MDGPTDRERERKRRALSLLALDPDLAAVGLHDRLANRQTQACPSLAGISAAGRLLVLVKEALHFEGRNADAAVRDVNANRLSLFLPRANLNGSPVRGELERIAQEICQNLL